jgi:hypothetical protein
VLQRSVEMGRARISKVHPEQHAHDGADAQDDKHYHAGASVPALLIVVDLSHGVL